MYFSLNSHEIPLRSHQTPIESPLKLDDVPDPPGAGRTAWLRATGDAGARGPPDGGRWCDQGWWVASTNGRNH